MTVTAPTTTAPPAPAPPAQALPAQALPAQALRVAAAPSCEPTATPTRRTPLRVVRSAAPDPGHRSPRPLPYPVDPGALVAATRVLRLALEVEQGRRNPRQLVSLLAPELVDVVTARARVWPGRGEPPAHLRVVHVQQTGADSAEAFAVVDRGARSHAVAARLERRAQGWWCVALLLR